MTNWPDSFESFADQDSFSHILNVWQDLRDAAGTKTPAKAALKPGLIGPLLPKIIISELDGDDMRIRLTGTVVDAILGMNMTGRNISDLYTGDVLAALMKPIRAALGHPCGMVTRRHISVPEGGTRTWQTLLLPLAAPDGEAKFLIGLHEVPEEDRRYLANGAAVDTLTIGLAKSAFFDLGFGVPDAG